ncbi:MAG: hypothetical protein LBQ73_00305 [Tannerellaceae bacterium]|jgi:hypothetical protein|nr:hypothetical protein [Tannerellaceae bacterium]
MLQEMIISIREGERLSDALKRRGYNGLPSNCIIDKTLPGLGVTYCELMSDRDSIIVEPNVPVIKGKMEKHKNVLGVYSGVSPRTIADYLLTPSTFRKKILITPDTFFMVKEIMKELNINMYEEFFLLLDECEKDFPVEEMREDFFRFRNRSFVTVFPIIAGDPLMKENGFFTLTVRPEYECKHKQKLKLLTTNNIVETLLARIAQLKGPVCIFCHSDETIESLVSDIPLLQEKGYVFRNEDAFVPDTAKLYPYNLFTSHYYLAVDIELPLPPHVILISDLFSSKPSFIDPKTEVPQIIGRFRGGVSSVTHISNIDPELNFYTSKQARIWLKNAGKIYAGWLRKKETTQYEGAREILEEALQQSTYARFVDKEGKINPIGITKFIEKEMVKGLYTHTKLLLEAYQNAECFQVSHEREVHIFSDKDRLSLRCKLTQEGRNRLLLSRFEQLEVLRKVRSSKAQTRYRHLIDRLINNPSDSFLYNCFLEYGSNFIRNSGYKEYVMRKEINRND